jgi:hypothetical protein
MYWDQIAFEAVTATLVAAVPLYILWLWRRWSLLSSKDFHLTAATVLIVGWCFLVYGSFVEPRLLKTSNYEVKLGDTGREFTVAVVGDTHLGVYKGETWLKKVVERTNALQPDVVLLNGDIVASAAGLKQLAPLKDLRGKFGVFATLGNFEYRVGAVDARRAIESYGVEMLTNESVALSLDGDRSIRLLGIDDIKYGRPDWDAVMSEVEPDSIKILASHNPDAVSAAENRGIDLVLSAHTHGGQVRLPFFGPLMLPTHIGRQFDRGLFAYGNTYLFITPGVGESGPRARLFCPPEISLVRIRY